jgi:hypothetical protein
VRAAGALAIIAFTLLKIIRFEGFLPARGR